MVFSKNLSLPYLAAAQAQKHVTHNEALRALDALVQLAVIARDVVDPPAAPEEGDRYLVPEGASGAWSGRGGRIAAFQDGAWMFYQPRTGWLLWVEDEGVLLVLTDLGWQANSPGIPETTDLLGINTTADTTNRLAVAADASLFSHAGDSHQLKVNRSSVEDTASIVFQTDFGARAEIGTVGDDKLRIKVSSDGTNWQDAVVVDPSSGFVGTGTVTPQSRLHLAGRTAGAGLTGLRVEHTDTATNATRLSQFSTQFIGGSWRTFFTVAGATPDQGSFHVFSQDAAKRIVLVETDSTNNFGRLLVYDRNNLAQIELRATTSAAYLNAGSAGGASGEYRVQGQRVVGARGASVPDATGGAVVDVEARAAINALLSRLRASTGHGLIA